MITSYLESGELGHLQPISHIDPERGVLTFRGHDADELARNCIFEDVFFLLLNGSMPTKDESHHFREKLLGLRKLIEPEIPQIVAKAAHRSATTAPRITNGIDRTEMLGLRILAGNLDSYAKKYDLNTDDALLLFVAMAPLVLAAGWRRVQNKELIMPNERLGHSHNFYWMARGSELPIDEERDLETCFILHMDDPDNPSLSKLEECQREGRSLSETLVAVLDRHVDPLHHGAGELSMQMIMDIGHSKEVEPYLGRRLQNGELIYGLGHRIYQFLDPRARVLRGILERRTKNTANYALTCRIEEVARVGAELILKYKGKIVYPNVDLYNAAFYHSSGLPYFMNTELFAVARSAGWAAHILQVE